jgi:hypothetical protein
MTSVHCDPCNDTWPVCQCLLNIGGVYAVVVISKHLVSFSLCLYCWSGILRLQFQLAYK